MMSKISLSCAALLELTSLESLKEAILCDSNNIKWRIAATYKDFIDLESLNKIPSEKPRRKFDPDDYKYIEIDLKNFPNLQKSDIERQVAKAKLDILIYDFKNKLLLTKANIKFDGIKLNQQDVQLCLAWSDKKNYRQMNIKKLSSIFQEINSYEASRLISARIAEKAAIKFFSSLKFNVEDVSIKQLFNEDRRWQDYDLKVNNIPVDVKNARTSFSSKYSYSEHTIPRFKIARELNQECNYFGVFSKYIKPENIDTEIPECLVLGLANLTSINILSQWMTQRFGNFLEIQNLFNTKFQPGWLFEYPDNYYSTRKILLDGLPELITNLISLKADSNSIPKWLLSLCKDDYLTDQFELQNEERQIQQDIKDLNIHVGISRSSLYCFVLGYFLESIAIKREPIIVRSNIFRAIFLSDQKNDHIRPLGLHDPMMYVFNLITILSNIYTKIIESKFVFKAFKLTHPQILKGLNTDGNWITLYAYCGGWIQYPNVRCGAIPIYFGQDVHCEICGRLICSKCNFCSNNCPRFLLRQGQSKY